MLSACRQQRPAHEHRNVQPDPGGTSTFTDTISQFDATLRIKATLHVSIVNGEPTVEHEVTIVRASP